MPSSLSNAVLVLILKKRDINIKKLQSIAPFPNAGLREYRKYIIEEYQYDFRKERSVKIKYLY